ncbi:MAG: CBS domain-containing protein, partial [Desulfobacterales bacterium]
MLAREIMETHFQTLTPEHTISQAVHEFHRATQAQGKKIFGLMVTDDRDRLVGMLSIYDILIFMQPKHVHIWGEMEDMDFERLFEDLLERVKDVRVADIMTTEVVTISPTTHLMIISDIMIKKHIRRLPVINNDQVLGIVYVSDVFHHLLHRFL